MILVVTIEMNGMILSGHNSYTEIAGESVTDSIEVSSFDIGLQRMVTDSGTLRGVADFKALNISKRIDAASPLLLQGLHMGSSVEVVKLRMFDNDETGADRLVFTITLSGARLASLDWDGVSGDGTNGEETLRIMYTDMIVTYSGDTHVEAQVSWTAGAGA